MSLFSVNELGVITVDTSVIRADVEQAYKKALGSDLDVSSGTAQGQLIDYDMKALNLTQESLLKVANSFLPFYAVGDELDRSAAVFGYMRKLNQPTVVVCTLTGAAGTIIPAGSLVSDGTYQFAALDNTTLPSTGSINAQFASTTSGAIQVLPGTVTTIVTNISGWDTVTNNYAGATGYATETDNAFKQRITANWLNIRAIGLLGAIVDNIAQLDGVLSVVGRENAKSITQVVDGVTMERNSIYLCVLGGNGNDIATCLGRVKTLGAGTVGDTVVGYYDPNADYTFYYKIRRPDVVDLSVQINYERNLYTPADITDKIKNQLLSYIAENGFKIGQTISGNMLAQAFDDFPYMDLLSVKVNVSGETGYLDYLSLSIEQVAALSADNIATNEVSND